MQQWSDSSESVTVDFLWMPSSGRTITQSVVVQIIVIKTPLFRIGVTRTDLKHCGKMPDTREELNRSVKEGRIESRHYIKSLEGMG